jgi:hypothetical protein
VNFTDQSINANLALKSSSDGLLCTLDLSEASDRVSWSILQQVLPERIARAFDACRSDYTLLPNGVRLELKKYAPQGAATCFPLEALYFFFLSRALYRWECGSHTSQELYVYGDDIICDHHTSSLIIDLFPSFGLKINEKKSFCRGLFRESCGIDAFDGIDITPIRLRHPVRDAAEDPSAIVSLVSTMNQLWSRAYYKTSIWLREWIQRKLKSTLPNSLSNSPYLGVENDRFPLPLEGFRKHQKTFSYRVKAFVVKTLKEQVPYSAELGGREYFKKLTQGWHPEYISGSYSVKHRIKLVKKWAYAYS